MLAKPIWSHLVAPGLAPLHLRCSRWRAGGAAAVLVILATLLRLPFGAVLGLDSPFLFYYPATVVAAWLGGLEAGLLATLLGALAADYFWMPPLFDFSLSREDALRMTLFVMAGGSAAFILERLQRTLEGERAAKEHLLVALGNTRDAVVTTDVRGRVVFLNAPAQLLTGCDASRAAGQAFADVFLVLDGQKQTPLQYRIQQGLVEGGNVPLPGEAILIVCGGKARRVEPRFLPLLDRAGQRQGGVLLFREIG